MFVTIVGGLLLLAALGAATYSVRQHLRVQETLRSAEAWPYRKGTVTRSEVVRTRNGLRGHTVLTPRIEYTYEVDGERFTGSKVDLCAEIYVSSASAARRVCERYPVGAIVEVWYDRLHPSACCLERKGPGATSVVIAALVFAAVMAAGVLHLFESI